MKTKNLDKAFYTLEDDFGRNEEDTEKMQHVLEILDNKLWKNTKGTERRPWRQHIVAYLEALFTGYIASDKNTEINSAYCIGRLNWGKSIEYKMFKLCAPVGLLNKQY